MWSSPPELDPADGTAGQPTSPRASAASGPTAVPAPLSGWPVTHDVPQGSGRGEELDWSRVRQLRAKAAAALTGRLARDRDAGRPPLDEVARRELARALIVQVLEDDTDARLSVG